MHARIELETSYSVFNRHFAVGVLGGCQHRWKLPCLDTGGCVVREKRGRSALAFAHFQGSKRDTEHLAVAYESLGENHWALQMFLQNEDAVKRKHVEERLRLLQQLRFRMHCAFPYVVCTARH